MGLDQQAIKSKRSAAKKSVLKLMDEAPAVVDSVSKYCGAKLKTGKTCKRLAGTGTDHKGFGKCNLHGGNFADVKLGAERQQAIVEMVAYGGVVEIDPFTALLDEVKRTAGHVAWLREMVQQGNIIHDSNSVNESGETSESKPESNIYLDLYKDERMHLVRVCKVAIDAGVAEQQIKLMKVEAEAIAAVFMKVFNKLGMSPSQWDIARSATREALLEISAGGDHK